MIVRDPRIKIRQLNTRFYLAKSKSRPKTGGTVSSGRRGTYTITIFLQSAWVPVCAFRDIATFVFFFFFLNRTSNTRSQTHGSAVQRLAHVHAKHQFDQRRQN